MKRSFNYTGRKRITLDRAKINLNRPDEKADSFSAVINLAGLDLPFAAKVYVEAYHRTELSRFDFGMVGEMVTPVDTGLFHLAHRDHLRFRIIVVDESAQYGMILASADGIAPEGSLKKEGILPVDFQDIGRQVWKVDYSGDDPTLVLNVNIPNIHNIAGMDPQFHMSVYPAVTREILNHMFFIDKLDDLEEPPLDWHKRWLDFARRFVPVDDAPERAASGEGFDDGSVSAWVDKVVGQFCASRHREWRQLMELEEVD